MKGTGKSLKLVTELRVGPSGENPKNIGIGMSANILHPTSPAQFLECMNEQQELLEKMIRRVPRDQREELNQRIPEVREYCRVFRRIVIGADSDLMPRAGCQQPSSPNHITMWAGFLRLHTIVWNRAVVQEDGWKGLAIELGTAYKNFHQNDILHQCLCPTGDMMMDAMVYLGYSCPKCGTVGFCDSVCSYCERGTCFRKEVGQSGGSKADFSKKFEDWKKRQPAGAKVGRADYRAAFPTSHTSSKSPKSARETWEWLATHQGEVVAHRAFDRSA